MGKWLGLVLFVGASAWGQQKPLMVEHGTYTIHMLLHVVGKEEYRVMALGGGQMEMVTTSQLSDRGTKRAIQMTLDVTGKTFEPVKLEQDTVPASADGPLVTEIAGAQATVREGAAGRTFRKPPVAFLGFAAMPASLQMEMMRYWRAHGQPAKLTMLRANVLTRPASSWVWRTPQDP